MGRPRKFNREGVLAKALPVFWNQGFSGTTLQQLEQATGVNKSGLYAEFADKDDLFFHSLRFYFQKRGAQEILAAQPRGWGNIERFLRLAEQQPDGQRGCFAVNSLREFPLLPPQVRAMVTDAHRKLRPLLVDNIRAAQPIMAAERIADIVMVFFSGFCIEQNLPDEDAGNGDRIASFIQAMRLL
ncbi:TetR/AcrR family transcriptional regulator [Sodalis sp. RH21]|uniref:TetR/AcrR family transcriptional regulator n=1 Tax=unclassified Sodalis (in: enterobacteria) TaxID=2636512 RepID=UPI0039B51FBE